MFNVRKKILLGGIALCALLPYGQAYADTLQEAVQTAIQNHPSIEAARAVELTAQETQAEARSDFFPQLSASLTGGRMFANNSTSRGLTVDRGEAYSWLWEGNASLTQPIFDGMETFNRVDAANARMEAANLTVADTQENIALRAAQAYIGLLQAQETVQKVKDYKAKLTDYLDRVELLVDEGAADEVEAAQARNINLLLDETLAQSEGQVDAALATYKEIVGRMPESALEKPPAGNAMLYASADEAVEYAKINHPLILSSLNEIDAAGYDVDAERGVLFPDLDGELSYQQRDQKEEIGGELEDARALLRLSWNFATGGGDFARVRKTKAQHAEKLAEHRDTLRQVERDIVLAYKAMETAKRQKSIAEKRQKITQTLFGSYESQFEGARIRLLQLMQADNQLFGARLENLNADYTVLLTEYAALASTGQLQQALELAEGPMPLAEPIQEEAVELVPEEEKEPFPPKQVDDKVVHSSSFKGLIAPAPETSEEADIMPVSEPLPVSEPEADMEPVIEYEEKTSTPLRDERVYPDLGE